MAACLSPLIGNLVLGAFLFKYNMDDILKSLQNLPHYWSEKGFKGPVVNRTCSQPHGRSLESIRTVSLRTKEPCPSILKPMRVKHLYWIEFKWKPTSLFNKTFWTHKYHPENTVCQNKHNNWRRSIMILKVH